MKSLVRFRDCQITYLHSRLYIRLFFKTFLDAMHYVQQNTQRDMANMNKVLLEADFPLVKYALFPPPLYAYSYIIHKWFYQTYATEQIKVHMSQEKLLHVHIRLIRKIVGFSSVRSPFPVLVVFSLRDKSSQATNPVSLGRQNTCSFVHLKCCTSCSMQQEAMSFRALCHTVGWL